MEKKQFWKALKSGHFASMVRESSKGRCLSSSMQVFNVMKRTHLFEKIGEQSFYIDGKQALEAINKELHEKGECTKDCPLH